MNKKSREIKLNHIIMSILLFHIFTYTSCSESIFSSALFDAIINHENKPKPVLLELLKETHTAHTGTLPSIALATQSWLRPAGKERWEFQHNPIATNNHLPELFKNLCLMQRVEPSRISYDYAVLFGGTLDDVRNRLAYLIALSNKGITFNSLVILTGQRLLDTTLESHELLLNDKIEGLPSQKTWYFDGKFPTTEPEMIKFVFEQTDIPSAWNKTRCFFVDAPMQTTENGSFRRPNTQDTITQWLKECNPRPGSILALSNQPFVGYQNSVLRNTLPKTFTIETVGNAYANNESLATIFDTLARWIYNENQIAHNQQAKY